MVQILGISDVFLQIGSGHITPRNKGGGGPRLTTEDPDN